MPTGLEPHTPKVASGFPGDFAQRPLVAKRRILMAQQLAKVGIIVSIDSILRALG